MCDVRKGCYATQVYDIYPQEEASYLSSQSLLFNKNCLNCSSKTFSKVYEYGNL